MPSLHILYEVLGCVALGYTFPLVTELLVLSIACRLPAASRLPIATSGQLRLWAVVPAHNEEGLIAPCVQSLLAAAKPPDGVLVIAHNCLDRTADLAEQAGASVFVLKDEGLGGKGAALQAGFVEALARGADAVLVVDADSKVSSNLPEAVRNHLQRGAHAVQCRYLAADPDASPRTRLMAVALLGMNLVRPLGRERLGLSCGIFGNGFALTRGTLVQVPYSARSVVEDLEYHLLLLRAHSKVQFVDEATVFGETPQHNASAATQRARWEGGRSYLRHHWAARLIGDVVRGRIRMLEPLLDLLAVPVANGLLALVLALLLPVSWVRAYACLGLSVCALYVFVSATFATQPLAALGALFSAPRYILWKLINLPRTRRASRRNATWVRTGRN